MKLKKALLSLAAAMMATSAMAQTGVASGTPFGSGQDSIRCRQNLSLFSGYAKAGSYQDAYEPWKNAYEECPGSNKNIYIYGARILKWKIQQETDATKREAILEQLLKMYDTRAKYFGDDPRYGVGVIIGNKIDDYVKLSVADKVDYAKIYDWAKPIVEKYGEAAAPQLLFYYVFASRVLAQKDETKHEAYINDYLLASEYLDKQTAAAADDEKTQERIAAYKAPMDEQFASSGLAGCDILTKIYTPEKVEANKANKAFLKQTCALFSTTAECDAPAYFQASRYLFELEPSTTAAMGLAGKAFLDKNYSEANEYLNKAIQIADNASDKVKCYELLADIAVTQGNYSAARAHTNNALAINPKSGRSLIKNAMLLAMDADRIFPNDKIKQRCVFYLVIDKLRAAAAADSRVAAEANRQISRYTAMLPSAADIFMHPELGQGKPFTVPGYGTTTIR